MEPYAEFRGTLNPGQLDDVLIPVDAMTSSLGISVRSENDLGEPPLFGRMVLFDLRGDIVEQFAADSGLGQVPLQFVNVLLHDAPAGGHLLVQITTAAGASSTGTDPTVGFGSGPELERFIRPGRPAAGGSPAPQGAPPAQGLVAVGTLLFMSASQSELALCPRRRLRRRTRPPAIFDGQALVTEAADSPPAGLVPERADGFNVRVPTGPLASRSAGPLGPILASWEADLTPAVDRHERGLFQEIDGLDVESRRTCPSGLNWPRWIRPPSLRDDSRASDLDQSGGSIVALTGAGGFPLKVTGLAGGERAELPALLASIPATAASERSDARPAETDTPIAVVPVPWPRNRFPPRTVRIVPTTSRRPSGWRSGWTRRPAHCFRTCWHRSRRACRSGCGVSVRGRRSLVPRMKNVGSAGFATGCVARPPRGDGAGMNSNERGAQPGCAARSAAPRIPQTSRAVRWARASQRGSRSGRLPRHWK